MTPPPAPLRVVLCGVAGSGKTTVGQLLATALALPFVDADDCHDAANREHMASGQPLDEAMRSRWLAALRTRLQPLVRDGAGFVLACSALRAAHRDTLAQGLPGLRWVHLAVDAKALRTRLAQRRGHFFPASLLDSQLATWEPFPAALRADAALPPAAIVAAIQRWLAAGAPA